MDNNLDTELKNRRGEKTLTTGSNSSIDLEKPQTKSDSSNDDARKRTILFTKETSGPITFVLDKFGGVVDTPICKIMFPNGAVLTPMEITMTAKYQNEDLVNNKEQVIMTPEIFFTSKDRMIFLHPVEVHMQTPYQAANRRKNIPVQIERTEHRLPLKWKNYREVIFHEGMIKFFCDEFCGYRVRCDMCQLHGMSTRISYCFTVPDNINPTESEKRIYLRVFSDTPQNHENINREMKADGHHRIHPTETYTVRARHNLMIRITGKDLNCLPSYHIAEVETNIMSRAFRFTLSRPNNASKWEFDAEIAEISTSRKTKIQFDSNAHVTNGIISPAPINVSGHGIGVQYNISMTESSQICGRLSPGERRRDAPDLVSSPAYPSHNSLESGMFGNRSEGDGGNEDMETKPMKTWLTESISHGSTTSNSSISAYSHDTVTPVCSAETKPKETWLTKSNHLNKESLSGVSFTSQSSDTASIVSSSQNEHPSAFHKVTEQELSDPSTSSCSQIPNYDDESIDDSSLLGLRIVTNELEEADLASVFPVRDLLDALQQAIFNNQGKQEEADSEISFPESGFDSGAAVNSRNMSAMSTDYRFSPVEFSTDEIFQYQDDQSLNTSDQAQIPQDQASTEKISGTSVKKSYSDVVKTTIAKRTSRNGSCDDVKKRPKWKY